MSNELNTARRLRSWHAGRALERGEKVNVHIGDDDEILCVSFIRMGGESLPWGVALGHPDREPMCWSVPDPRNRDLVADMMIEAGRTILAHFGHPEYADGIDEAMSVYNFRQVWLPGTSHLELLHSLAFAYARSTRDRADLQVLRDLGQLANCLFIETQRPGQQTVMVATNALTTAYDFPSSSVRQAHLGHLMAWLGREKSRDSRLRAATEAEKIPVATTLDPDFERTELGPLVERWNAAPREDRLAKGKRIAHAISVIIDAQLTHRHGLIVKTIDRLRKDPRQGNMGLVDLVRLGTDKFSRLWWDQVLRDLSTDPNERAFWPGLWSDYNAREAAFAYQQRVSAARQAAHSLIHGDLVLQEEELLRGHAVRGKVASVDGGGASWTLAYDSPELPQVKIGGSMVIAGSPKLEVKILSISPEDKKLMVAPKWSAARSSYGPTAKAAGDPKWKGQKIILIEDFPANLTETLSYRIRSKPESGFDILDYFGASSIDEFDVGSGSDL